MSISTPVQRLPQRLQSLLSPSSQHVFQYLNRLELLSPNWHGVIAAVALAVIAFTDYITGTEIHFFIFYALPIAYISWFLGRRQGFFVVLAASVTFWVLNVYLPQAGHPLVAYWNLGVRLLFFMLVSQGIGFLNKAYEYLQLWAETDPLTGLKNRRVFFEHLNLAMARCQRAAHPLTLAYIDLDHFKQVNDQLGHAVGDELLQRVAQQMEDSLRKTDLVARLGGDEFAVVLEGNSPAQSEQVLMRLQQALLTQMQSQQWPVTFSMGAMTFLQVPADADAMVHEADQLMYGVKRSGRGRLAMAVFPAMSSEET